MRVRVLLVRTEVVDSLMIANLFLRAEGFRRVNGFDEEFDKPDFREDTDLGGGRSAWATWRSTGETVHGVDERFYRSAAAHLLREDYSTRKKVLGREPKVQFQDVVEMMVDADLRNGEIGKTRAQQQHREYQRHRSAPANFRPALGRSAVAQQIPVP